MCVYVVCFYLSSICPCLLLEPCHTQWSCRTWTTLECNHIHTHARARKKSFRLCCCYCCTLSLTGPCLVFEPATKCCVSVTHTQTKSKHTLQLVWLEYNIFFVVVVAVFLLLLFIYFRCTVYHATNTLLVDRETMNRTAAVVYRDGRQKVRKWVSECVYKSPHVIFIFVHYTLFCSLHFRFFVFIFPVCSFCRSVPKSWIGSQVERQL